MKKMLISLILSSVFAQIIFGRENIADRRERANIPWTTQSLYVSFPCKVAEVDSQVYYNHWRLFKTIERVFPFEKRKGKIKIKSQHRTFIFRDVISNKYYHEFFPWGQFQQWLVVYGQDYHEQRFYMINLNTDSLTTLIGEPRIYDDKILCIESDYADSPLRIELWKMNADSLFLQFSESLRSLGLYGMEDWFISDNHVFLRCNQFEHGNSIIKYYEIIID